MNKTNNTWKFPANIEFDVVPQYLKKFEKINHGGTLTFDLSNNEYIHSSFIGFLIHEKRKTERENGKLVLIISPYLERIFRMLKLTDFLTYSCISKTA